MKILKFEYLEQRERLVKVMLVCVILSAGFVSTYGQQYPSYTQYTMNKFVYNPAAAGMDGFTTINLIAKEQWVGYKGTPRTHAITIDSRILGNSYILKKLSVRKKKPEKTRSGNTAWGGYFFNDLNGPIDKTGINGSYSYHIPMGESQLSFGLSMMLFQLKIQSDQFVFSDDLTDPLLSGSNETIWIPDANFGIYFTGANYYAGYSTIQLLNSSVQFGQNGAGEYSLERQHTLVAGYSYYASNRIQVEPSLLIKLPENFKVQMDLSVKATYDGKYWGGLNYRTGSSVSIFGGLKIDRYYFGYAFDYSIGTIMKNTYGSHEFIVSARIGDAARRYKWLNSY